MLPRLLCATETVATPAPDAAVEAGALVVVAVLCGEVEPLVAAAVVVLLPPQPASASRPVAPRAPRMPVFDLCMWGSCLVDDVTQEDHSTAKSFLQRIAS